MGLGGSCGGIFYFYLFLFQRSVSSNFLLKKDKRKIYPNMWPFLCPILVEVLTLIL